ncbi:unnamed protein product [Pararhodospirillum photometricum DSM 122]|uniref:Transposase n=1 Tax=Pararhodospirillum photometricum DSM 122 TaxID=1150469 RepID=H6SN76_PARPM|nr:unnamed protein product [Pararhodospirillum photometricum DSM 122]
MEPEDPVTTLDVEDTDDKDETDDMALLLDDAVEYSLSRGKKRGGGRSRLAHPVAKRP